MADIEEAVIDRIVDQLTSVTLPSGEGTFTAIKGTNAFAIAERPSDEDQFGDNATFPRKCIFAEVFGGPTPRNFLGGGTTPYKRPQVQVMVRWSPVVGGADSIRDGLTVARAVWTALHAITQGAMTTLTDHVGTVCQQPEPIRLKTNEGGNLRWVINTEVWHGGQ